MSALRRLGFFLPLCVALASHGWEDARAEGKTHTVRIERGRFEPKQVSAEVGDLVVWENRDSRPHRIRRSGAGGEDSPINSGLLRPGKTYSYRVRGVASIPYECTLDPEMNGTIDVIVNPADRAGRD